MKPINSARMKRLNADPAFKAQQSARMKRLNADPAFKAKMKRLNADPAFKAQQSARMKRLHADPAFNPLAALSAAERADYDVLKKAGYGRAEALRAIGRADMESHGASAAPVDLRVSLPQGNR
jgi:hypothetical protein